MKCGAEETSNEIDGRSGEDAPIVEKVVGRCRGGDRLDREGPSPSVGRGFGGESPSELVANNTNLKGDGEMRYIHRCDGDGPSRSW